MKKTISLCFATFYVIALLAQTNVKTGIQFFKGSWKELLDSSRQSNKMIFVDVYTDWCGPCKYMEKFIFTRQAVGKKYNGAFLNYKVNAEKGEGAEIARKYGIEAFPTFLFLNSDGYLIHKVVGEADEIAFVNLVTEAKKQEADVNNLGNMEQRFRGGDRDPLFLHVYLDRLAEKRMTNSEVLDAYFNNLTDQQLNRDSTLIYLAKNITGTQTSCLTYFISHYDQLSETSKTQLARFLFDRFIRQFGGIALKEKRLLEYLTLRKFADKLYGLNDQERSLLNQHDLKFGVLVKDYSLVKKAGYTYTTGLLSIPVDSIRREDKRRFDKAMLPFIRGERDSTKMVGFEEEKKYVINIYSREISSPLYIAAEAFSHLPPTEKPALNDALTWAQRGAELMPDVIAFPDLIKVLEKKLE